MSMKIKIKKTKEKNKSKTQADKWKSRNINTRTCYTDKKKANKLMKTKCGEKKNWDAKSDFVCEILILFLFCNWNCVCMCLQYTLIDWLIYPSQIVNSVFVCKYVSIIIIIIDVGECRTHN